MSRKAIPLESAPELSLHDLLEIKVPLDLLELLSLDFCVKHRIVPLRLDPQQGLFSYAFVEQNDAEELERIASNKGWNFTSAYRVSDVTFSNLLEAWKAAFSDATQNPQIRRIALIDSKEKVSKAFKELLEDQGFSVSLFENINQLMEHLKKDYPSALVDYEIILNRGDNPDFTDEIKAEIMGYLPKVRVQHLSKHWIESIFQNKNASSDFDFHVKHENFYQAAMTCMKDGDLVKAIDLLEQVPPSNSYYLKAQFILGKAFLKKKNYQKASQHLQKAYDQWCDDPDAIVDESTLSILYYLGQSFEKQNHMEDALRLYERVAGENPLFKQVNHHIARIKEHQRKANKTREKKEGFPAFSRGAREVSRYEKIEEIGRGGMGIVHRAKDRVLGREVALKILNSHFKHDEKIVETFLREAKSLAALNHLHIVTVFDAGIEEGNYYIAMEYIEGKTVRDLLKKKGHFRLSTALILCRQVLKALAYAHSKKVIHRDITTNNMMLTESKIIKLMDFGLARVVNQLHSEQSIIGGTPYFMSPEQVEGAPIDHRTDIYSFGVCLYEMLTGQVPFPMENPGYHHLHTPAPSARIAKADVPEAIDEIILKCLEKRPDDRFSSADQILELLKSFPTSESETSLSKSRSDMGL